MRRRPEKAQTASETRTVKGSIDWMLVVIVLALLVFGLVMLYSASSYEAQIKFSTPIYYVRKQLIATVLGLIVMFLTVLIPHKVIEKLAIPLFIVAVVLMCLVRSPLGLEANGAYRWLDFKFITVQPSEVLKVALIITLAMLLSRFLK